MAKHREYTRELTDWETEHIRRLYKDHVNSRKYVLTKRQRQILLGEAKKEEGATEYDLWYNVRKQAKKGLLDLELLVSVASDRQLEEIFKPFTSAEYTKLDVMFGSPTPKEAKKRHPDVKGEYTRTDLARILRQILKDSSTTLDRNDWRYKLAVSMVTEGLDYLGRKTEFQSRLHSRLFEDVRDSI